MADATLLETIEALPPGKIWGARGSETFCLVRRTDQGYEVECGWRVPERYEDDADSYTYHPLKGVPCPWVGRRFCTPTAAAAVTVYGAYKVALRTSRLPTDGMPIGSVSR